MNPVRQYVEDMLTNIGAIERFTADGRNAFLADDKTQYAVIRAYELIGEVVNAYRTAGALSRRGVEADRRLS